MKRNPEDPAAGRPAPAVPVCRAFWTLLWKLGLAALLAYGALHLLVRTDFFRARVEAELSRLAGMEMRVGRIRATESLNLKLRDVISVSKDAGFEVRTLRIRWRLFRPRHASMLESLRMEGLALTFAPDAEGALQPAFLGRVSRMLLEAAGAESPGGRTESAASAAAGEAGGAARFAGPVEVRWASVRWQDAGGNLQASISNMELAWLSLALPNGRQIAHVDLRAAEVKLATGLRIMGLHVELLDAGERQFLVALDAADWGTARRPRAVELEYRELLDAME